MSDLTLVQKFDEHLFEELARLFIKKDFKKEILLQRIILGIPENGFFSNEEYIKWIRKRKKNVLQFFNIRGASVKLGVRFKLPINYSFWIEAYLLLGNNYRQFNAEHPIKELQDSSSRGFDGKTDFVCALEKDDSYQCINIKIYPGATQNNVIDFVERNFKTEIEPYLNTFDLRIKQIRIRKAKRDRILYELKKNGILNDGKIIPISPEAMRDLSQEALNFIETKDRDMLNEINNMNSFERKAIRKRIEKEISDPD